VSGDVIDVSPQGSGSGLDADTVDGIEASSLGSDVSNNGTTVTNSATDLNFTTNLGASNDGDGTSTISVDISDDEAVSFGSNDDISQRYDSTNDSFRIKDETNNNDRLELERTTGNLSISGELTENASL
jgi:spore coat protein U-like protein